MVVEIPKIADIPFEEQTPLVLMLLELLNALYEENQLLRDEIARLKGEKPKPGIKPSVLEPRSKKESKSLTKRPGSAKRDKTRNLEIHETVKVKPENLPSGSTFKGYIAFSN